MTDHILAEQTGAIRTITLNAPERRNPISDMAMIDALCDAMKAAGTDSAVRVVVLTGAGSAFSSGGDVKKMAPGRGLRDALPVRTRGNYREGIQRLPILFQSLDVIFARIRRKSSLLEKDGDPNGTRTRVFAVKGRHQRQSRT